MSPKAPTATTFVKSGITSVELPLTTVFQRPEWCDKIGYTYLTQKNNLNTFLREANGPAEGRDSSCYPPEFSSFRKYVEGTYLPGVCPLGYQPFSYGVYSSTAGATAKQYFLHESLCCPSSMLLVSFTNQETLSTAFCVSKVTTTTVVYLNANQKSTITSPSPWIAADYPIFVAWRSNQLDYFTPKSAPLLTDISSRFATTSPKQPQSTPTAPRKSDDISPGEGVGIGVGVALFVCLAIVAGIGIFLLRRRKRRQYRPVGATAFGQPSNQQGAPRMGDANIYQLDTEPRRAEVSGSIPRVEMDGGWHGHELQHQKSNRWPS